jgi:hypothetical protein
MQVSSSMHVPPNGQSPVGEHWVGSQSHPHSAWSQVNPGVGPLTHVMKQSGMLHIMPEELDVALEVDVTLEVAVQAELETIVVLDDDDAPPEHWQRLPTQMPVCPMGAHTRSLHSVALHWQSH